MICCCPAAVAEGVTAAKTTSEIKRAFAANKQFEHTKNISKIYEQAKWFQHDMVSGHYTCR